MLWLGLACRQAETPAELVRVRGQVSVNGSPLRGATVVFIPERTKGTSGELSIGVTGDDGAFDLVGVSVGWHRITIAASPDDPLLAERLVRYRNPDTSDLTREVVAGQDSRFDIRLESP